jgi:hypothetical protein
LTFIDEETKNFFQKQVEICYKTVGFLNSALFLRINSKFKRKKLIFDTAVLVQQIILAIKIVRNIILT